MGAFLSRAADDDEESTLSSLLDEVEEVRVRGGLEMDDSDDIDMDLDDFSPPQQQQQQQQQQQKETPKEVNKLKCHLK